MGGRGSSSGIAKSSGVTIQIGGVAVPVSEDVLKKKAEKDSVQNHFSSKDIYVDGDFFDDTVDSKIRSDYLDGLDMMSDDFKLSRPISIKKDYLNDDGNVGYSKGDTNGGQMVINHKYISGELPYSKGNGEISWHSAHEYAHQIQYEMIMKNINNHVYQNWSDPYSDINTGKITFKKMIMEAHKQAKKIDHSKGTIYDRLESINPYANPKNRGSSWREAHSEAIGKYIQSKKNPSDTFGRILYNMTLQEYKK